MKKRYRKFNIKETLLNISLVLSLIVMIIAFAVLYKTCNECEEYTYNDEIVKAVIIDTYHQDGYRTFMHSGKVSVPLTRQETSITYLMYNNIEYEVVGKIKYEYCKDKIGQEIDVVKRTYKYNDDTTRDTIIDIIIP